MSQAVRAAYVRGEGMKLCCPGSGRRMAKSGRQNLSGDCVIFYNIRGEREIELTRSLTEKDFDEFAVARGLDYFATMIDTHKGPMRK